VGNIGSGPGEYIQLYDFCIDNVTRQLFLLCDRDIIMRYDYTGQFKEKHKVDFMSVKIEYFDDHFYFITEQIDFFNLIITDNKFKITQKLFPDKDFGKNRVRLLHPLKVDFNGVQYRRYMDNCIYRIKNHKDVIRQYEVDFGNKSVAFSELKKLDPNILNEKRITSRGELYSFTQNDETAIFYYGDNDESVIGFYDKKSRVAKNYFLHNKYDKYLENYYPLFFRYLTTNNEFVSEVYPAILFQNQTKNIIEKLNLSEDDNPVLYVVKMK
jgi:hypothetical protein